VHISLFVKELGESSEKKSYLPRNKKYLITKNGEHIQVIMTIWKYIMFICIIVKLNMCIGLNY
jgi:hypothetical protein